MVRGGYGSRSAFGGSNTGLKVKYLLAEWINLFALRLALLLGSQENLDRCQNAILLVLSVERIELRIEFGQLVLLALASCQGEYRECDDNCSGFTHGDLLERLCDTVVFIGREKQVLREIDLHVGPLRDGDRWRDLDEVVEDRRSRLRDAGGCAVGKGLRPGTGEI